MQDRPSSAPATMKPFSITEFSVVGMSLESPLPSLLELLVTSRGLELLLEGSLLLLEDEDDDELEEDWLDGDELGIMLEEL